MKTKTITLFTYDELSPEAQKRAREWYAQCIPDLWDSFVDSEIEHIAHCGAVLGIWIDQKCVTYHVDLWNSGQCWFCCSGGYTYNRHWRKMLRECVGGNDLEDLTGIARRLQDAQKPAFYALTAHLSPAYNHKQQHVSINWQDISIEPDDSAPGLTYGWSASEIRDSLRSFTDWCAQKLVESLEYLYSEDAIRENMICNEFTFDEEGNLED